MSPRLLVIGMLVFAVSACGSPPANEGGEPQPAEDAGGGEQGGGDAPIAGDGRATVRLDLEGGPMAGTYEAEGEKLDCNLAESGSGATWSDYEATNGLASFTFISEDGSTDPAGFSVYISLAGDEPMSESFTAAQEVNVNTGAFGAEPEGDGTARRTDSGDTITWDIEGTSAEGHAFTASISCGPVDRR